MPISTKIKEDGNNYKCSSRVVLDSWHFTDATSVFNNNAEVIDQFIEDCIFIKNGVKTSYNPTKIVKRHFNAHLKEIRLFLGIDKKPEFEEFDGYILLNDARRIEVFEGKIRLVSKKRFEFNRKGSSYWYSSNNAEYCRNSPKLNKLFFSYCLEAYSFDNASKAIEEAIRKGEK